MEKEEKISKGQESVDENEETDLIELVLFQVSECYVYIVRKMRAFWIFVIRWNRFLSKSCIEFLAPVM